MPTLTGHQPVSLLHLSDVQFGRNHRFGRLGMPPPDDSFDSLLVRLVHDIRALRDESGAPLTPDILVVSGDLTETGRPGEFADAGAFVRGLATELRLTHDRIVIVPGNHDVNRALCAAYFKECEGTEVEPVAPYWPKWGQFSSFLSSLGNGSPDRFCRERPWQLIEVPALRMVFAALNSTMRESHRDEDHYGWVGEAQCSWFAENLEPYRQKGWLRIAVVHHNVRRGAMADDENLRDAGDLERILRNKVNLVLHGHTHQGEIYWIHPALPVLATGSAAVVATARPDEVPNQYQLVRVHPGALERWSRAYAPDLKHWIGDPRVSQGDRWYNSVDVCFDAVQGTFETVTKPAPQPPASPAPLGPPQVALVGGRPDIRRELKPATAYQIALLSVDMVEHSALVREYPNEMRVLLGHFKSFVFKIVQDRNGDSLSWAADGGLFAFWKPDRFDAAVLAGIEILEGLQTFNLDPLKNPLSRAIELRIAATEGPLVFELPTDQISCESINYVVHLQQKGTRPSEFRIAETLLGGLAERLRSRFVYAERFESSAVRLFSRPDARLRPSDEELEANEKQLSEYAAAFKQRLDAAEECAVSAKEAGAARTIPDLGASLDGIYGCLEALVKAFATLDEKWAQSYFAWIAALMTRAMDLENEAWQRLTKALEGGPSDLVPIVQAFGARRSYSYSHLVHLRVQCERRSGRTMETPAAPVVRPGRVPPQPAVVAAWRRSESLMSRIRDLISADQLDEESALVALLSNERAGLSSLLSSCEGFEGRTGLLVKLWRLADLLVIEDLAAPRTPAILEALAASEGSSSRFGRLRDLLSGSVVPSRQAVTQLLAAAPTPSSPSDNEIVWRCVLVSGLASDRIVTAARELTLHTGEDVLSADSVWRTLAYPRVPIRALAALAGAQDAAKEDEWRLFFDCTRTRLIAAVTERDDGGESVGDLIAVFFRLPQFAMNPYFERLEDLVARFREGAQAKGRGVGVLESGMQLLNALRLELGNPQAELSPRVAKLPLAVQRHLAREERMYLDHFALHGENRIALETRRHINLDNVSRVISYRAINGMLMAAILRTREFFTRPSVVAVALNHPKCDQEFAEQYSRMLQKRELERVAANTSANSVVRIVIKKMLGRRP
jgi:3',5'-cyclic AMP phosphodiesterase CpdA